MNKNLVKELFDAFDDVKNQEELDKLKQEILNTIEVCYKSNSNKIKDNEFDNKVKNLLMIIFAMIIILWLKMLKSILKIICCQTNILI